MILFVASIEHQYHVADPARTGNPGVDRILHRKSSQGSHGYLLDHMKCVFVVFVHLVEYVSVDAFFNYRLLD